MPTKLPVRLPSVMDTSITLIRVIITWAIGSLHEAPAGKACRAGLPHVTCDLVGTSGPQCQPLFARSHQ